MDENQSYRHSQALSEKIFQLATGALALSVTFRSSIAPNDAVYKWVLSLAWISLSVCSLFYVFYQAQLALFHFKCESIAAAYKQRAEGSENLERPPDLIALTKIQFAQTAFCWVTSYIAFLLGVILFLVFALLNNR